MQDPLGVFERIREFFISYLETAFRIRSSDPVHGGISVRRRELMREFGVLCAEPLIEPILRYMPCRTSNNDATPWNFEQLVEEELGSYWLPGLNESQRRAAAKLIMAGLVPSRTDSASLVGRTASFPLYAHQANMMRRGLSVGRPGIVTSGTGSGKTESFLLPIFARIAVEAQQWPVPAIGYMKTVWWKRDGEPIRDMSELPDWPTATRNPDGNPFATAPHRSNEHAGRPKAVRALIIYPMNALVEDQLVRLRRALDSREARQVMEEEFHGNRIFFGRYTSATPVTSFPMKPVDQRGLDLHTSNSDEDKAERQRITARRQKKFSALVEELTGYYETQRAARELAGYAAVEAPWAFPEVRNVHSDSPFQFPAVDGSELLTRWDMQNTPPDILITNVSMLNGILTREVDAPIVEKTREWLLGNDNAYFYLVLDELHLHRGSAGSELAGLLRVLLHRLGLLQPEHRHKLHILCSSASLPTDGDKGVRSLEYLYDLFGRNGHWGGLSEPQPDITIWKDSIEKGNPVVPVPVSGPLPSKPFADLFNACKPSDQPDLPSVCKLPLNERARSCLVRIADEIGVVSRDREDGQWLGEVIAVTSDILASACKTENVFRASRVSNVCDKVFGSRDATPALRGLCMLRGLGDLPEIRKAMGAKIDQVPAFRVHTFLRSIDGLFGAFRSINSMPTLVKLDVERSWDYDDGDFGLRRVFELLYCEACGELFIGGKRASSASLIRSTPTELVPVDPDLDGIPESARSQRFEDLSYAEYALVWPRLGDEDRVPAIQDRESERDPGQWRAILLDTATGAVRDANASGPSRMARAPNADEIRGLLYVRGNAVSTDATGRRSDEPGTSVPYSCPACGTDYLPRHRNRSLRQSPIRNFRPGFAKTTQLMATELFSCLRLSDGSQSKLISFSDSRQDAARSDLDIQNGHHQDLVREIVVHSVLAEENRHASILSEKEVELATKKEAQEQAKSAGNFDLYADLRAGIQDLERTIARIQQPGIALLDVLDLNQANASVIR